MKQSITLCSLFLLAAVLAQGQSAKVPSFGQYRATLEKKTARAIDFKNSPGARSFRTRLSEALRNDNVNFAGRYILTGWGCGTGCISSAIIDAHTGRVYFPEPIGGIAVGSGDDGNYVDKPIDFKKNSRLVIVTGTPEIQLDKPDELPDGVYYYEWKNNRLRLVRRIVKKKVDAAQ